MALVRAVLINFHILWFLPRYKNEDYIDGYSLQSKVYDSVKKFWSVNVGAKKKPVYEPLFEFHQKWRDGKLYTNYDTHFVLPSLTTDGVSSVAFYCCKYMLKNYDDELHDSSKERRLQRALKLNYDPDEFEQIWSIVKSRSIRSRSFGLGFKNHNRDKILEHLKDGVKLSKNNSKFPLFFSPDSNKTFPLCPYYRSNGSIFTVKDWMDFHMDDSSLIVDFDKTFTQQLNGFRDLDRKQSIVHSKDRGLDFEILFDYE